MRTHEDLWTRKRVLCDINLAGAGPRTRSLSVRTKSVSLYRCLMAINWFIIPPDDAELVYTRHGRYVAVVINQKGMKHRRPQLNGAWMDGWMLASA